MPRKIRPLLERLMENVRVSDSGCWEWTGRRDRYGYGRIGRRIAHRAMYELRVGPIAAGLHTDHLCRNRACVNPDHIEPVSLVENVMRGFSPAAENARKTNCKNGHPLFGSNLRIDASGWRVCKECRRLRGLGYATRTGAK